METTLESTTPTTIDAISYLPPAPIVAGAVQSIPWQEHAALELSTFDAGGTNLKLLRGGTGLGKMYITCKAIRNMLAAGTLKQPDGSFNPFPVIWLCPKSVKPQTQIVVAQFGLSHLVMVYSYGEIKTSTGTNTFLTYETKLKNGLPEIVAVWNPQMFPALLVTDEVQALKNPDSLQTRVVSSCPLTVKHIAASATPFQRVADAELVLVRSGLVNEYDVKRTLSLIASPKSPDQYSPSSVTRLREWLESRNVIVELKNVRFKFQSKTICRSIQFKTNAQRDEYARAYDEYLEKIRKIRGQDYSHKIEILVAMQKFQQKAELLRVEQVADAGVLAAADGKQVIIGSNFIDTLRGVWHKLTKVHLVYPSHITFVTGGQTTRARQEQVEKFQRGDADYMLLGMRSGGVGISLHHDRPSTRPRHVIIPPCWSAIDLVQVLGRGHRLTSLSPTTQEILWFADTVEDRVKEVVEVKLNCITKSVTAKEQFIGLFEKASLTDEDNDELNELEQQQQSGNNDPDNVVEEVYGEGLENEPLPTTY